MNWEDGQIKTITVTAFAGNSHSHKGPGAGRKWKVLSMMITLVCDATVANRYIRWALQTTAGVSLGPQGQSNTAVTASQTKLLSLGPNDLSYEQTVAASNSHQVIANGMIVGASNEIYLDINGGVAGDSASGYIDVIELPN